jgi:hypothetical protein
MFLECDATVPGSNDKKNGPPHDLARVIDALTSSPVRTPGRDVCAVSKLDKDTAN